VSHPGPSTGATRSKRGNWSAANPKLARTIVFVVTAASRHSIVALMRCTCLDHWGLASIASLTMRKLLFRVAGVSAVIAKKKWILPQGYFRLQHGLLASKL